MSIVHQTRSAEQYSAEPGSEQHCSVPPESTIEVVVEAHRVIEHPACTTPLPKLQLVIICYIQLAEPIASTVIFPFVNQLVRGTGVTHGDERRTGYFSGLIESSFYATEAICVLQWGRASDHLGRKPILLGGLLGLTLSIIGFGLSKQFWSVVLARCAEGALCGNIGVLKGVIAEITDETNMAQAFSFLPMAWTIGATLGPVIGGLLARPADRWPNSVGKSAFFLKYPYFLPCITAACVSISAFVVASIFLKETLPANIRRGKHQNSKENEGNTTKHASTANAATNQNHKRNDDEVEKATSANPTLKDNHHLPLRSLLTRPIIMSIINYGFLAFIDQCFEVLMPLMYSSSISLGGLGFNSFTIGIISGVCGVLNGLFSILAFSKIVEKFGVRKVYIVAFANFLFCLAAFPVMSVLARRSGTGIKVWTVLVLQQICYMLAYMGYGCILLYINDGAPRTALGALNGLAQTTASIVRALAPSTATSLFSVSLEKDLLGGNLVYLVLCSIVVVGMVASYQLPVRARSTEI